MLVLAILVLAYIKLDISPLLDDGYHYIVTTISSVE